MEQQRARQFVNLQAGDPAPWFHGRTATNSNYVFDTAAGRYIVMCFYLSAGDAPGAAAIKSAMAYHRLFDDQRFSFFGISADPRDASEQGVADKIPGYRFLLDYDGAIS